jgi:hypothetical protein
MLNNIYKCEMLPLETKQSGGKLLPHSVLGMGEFSEEASCCRKRRGDILLGAWNVRSLYRAGSFTAAARELARYKLDLVGVQEVRWDKGDTVRAGDYNFFSFSLLSKNLKFKIHRTIILPVLYGCETWSLTLWQKHRLRVFENRVLRRGFRPKRNEVTWEWKKLHNEELRDLYSLPNIVRVVKSRRMRWVGHVRHMGEGRVVNGVLVGRPRCRWEYNIKMDLQEVGGGCADWMELLRIGIGGGHSYVW